ncbi:trifunctional serine/threonine-protein kinase/ATP-binding protein/sensor histidine kinase [Archangium lansingense]|uniref:histidine kinase n=1 Tax=Archangium lansingense TaxID=2995310 RepID=A0ABT4AL13_9BACT|nr:ATP-binding sensor histidine kinase [Archangium lansinium]MCY1081996.1 trifunctional serine/threonine-protein kinase/ATP-binding protein/sensor histidine kinase [Archangium lansinium]
MMDIPGYKLLGLFQMTSSSLLFQALREADQLPVIVKTPRNERLGPRERARYQREYSVLQHLRGTPGVLSTRGCEVLGERPVLLLDDVGGNALTEQLGRPLELSDFLSIAIPLAATLAEVHRRGVIHKDIKPANVLLSVGGQVWLIDFGLASMRQVERVESSHLSLVEGTLPYMSPEQSGRINRAVDYRTDFYSLGVTFYQLLTGRLPFRGRDPLEWLHAHISQTPVSPSELLPSIPPMLSAVVLKLLAKAADDRYQSAEGLKADLERCQEALLRGGREDFPLGLQDFPARFQLPQHLYGREDEIQALLKAFEDVAQKGRPEWVLVRGYSGIGKSSIVQELHKPVLERRGFFLSGKFNQLQRDVPYATLAQAIRAQVQQMLAGSNEEVEAWRQRLEEAFEGNGQVLVDLVPQLERVVGAQPPAPQLPPAEARNRFNLLFQRFLGVFASAERPLVLFLDDLQWADFASLTLLKYLSTHPDTPPLLLMGAYRDNEVSASHPLALVLEEARKGGARLTEIHLGPLASTQTRQLVADALPGASEALLVPLSELLQTKTGGNPFFLLQFLQSLYQDGLVERGPKGGWLWNADAVRAMGYADNVLDFMTSRLRKLPTQALRLLCLASCVGNTFALETLALLSHQESSEVELGLEPALQEELVVQFGSQHYRFLHDRIQQAAYTLLAEVERKAIHLEIGRLLWASLSPGELRERLFDVVEQLNAGVELLSDTEERTRLARLNAEAGFRAQSSTAHRSAIGYFSMALRLMPGDLWVTAPELAFKLRLGQANSELMSGNGPEARRIVEELLARELSHQELAAAYRLQSSIYLTANQPQAAAACLLECLARFGVHIPARPTWDEVTAANKELESLLGNRPIESLVELPSMTDPEKKTIMGLLGALFAPAFFTSETLLALHLCHMVSLTLRYGSTHESASAYVWYGFVTSCLFKNPHRGHAFGKLAMEFVERNDISAYRARVLFTQGHVSLWVRPLPEAKELYQKAFHQALLSGDLQIAGYCCIFIVWLQLCMGAELAEVEREAVTYAGFALKAGFRDAGNITGLLRAFARQMRGLTVSFGSLNGEGFSEEELEGLLNSAMAPLKCSYAVIKTRSRFMSSAYEEARQAADKAQGLLWAVSGRIQLLEHHLYRALVLAACCREATESLREQYLKDIQQHRRQLEEWATSCPETFRAAERMVAAELHRLHGRLEAAIRGYEEAIETARELGLIQNVAVASELAARFWKEQGVPLIALAYARQAREAYLQWGAEGKVRHLEEQWPNISHMVLSGQGTTSYDTGSKLLDALSLVKAQQAISSEMDLERLVGTLMRVAMENAGAQRGALLLLQGETLTVAALVESAEDEVRVVSPGHSAWQPPGALIAYVRRTGEHVLIDDTSRPHAFSSGSAGAARQAGSVLCLPLMRKEEFYGVLYLENSLTSEAFNSGRIILLQHLASQAAISMENARLYSEVRLTESALRQANEELESRVEERTRELRQAQANLVDTARMVGKAEVASSVLHDVGNALTSLVVDSDELRRTVAASRMGRVEQVVNLLAEHRDDLAGFLTKDPRGSQLFAYLSGLASELAQERVSLQQGMEDLSKNVDRVRTIIQMQQAYAKSTLLVEECDLAEVLEEALRLQAGALLQWSVQVTKKLEPLPRMKVDRHRLLQILLNLISNARQALEPVIPGLRRLLLRLYVEGEWIHFQVVDNGRGIEPEVQGRLFTQGFTTRKEGHGIGLHSSALAAQLMGGKLTLESAGPGLGATATFRLPASKADTQVA